MWPVALTHAEIPPRPNASELNNDGMIKLGDVTTKQTEFIQFYCVSAYCSLLYRALY